MSFKDWLSEIAVQNGLGDPAKLRGVLIRHDCHCGETQLREWLDGDSEPSFDKMRSVLSALQKELRSIDVWEHYRRFNEQGPDEAPGRAPGKETLESLLRNNPRLPPGLSDV